jgi:hypothetical protein
MSVDRPDTAWSTTASSGSVVTLHVDPGCRALEAATNVVERDPEAYGETAWCSLCTGDGLTAAQRDGCGDRSIYRDALDADASILDERNRGSGVDDV